MNIADLEFLTPGSVFTREDGRESRFLHLTNTALPRKLQAEFPQQVVYADENGNVLSCDVARFLKKRQFFNVDPLLEERLNNLLALSPAGGADRLDLDSDEDELTVVDGDSVFDSLPDTEEEEESEDVDAFDDASGNQERDIDEPLDTVKYLLVKPTEDLPAFLTASQLQAATASYQQGPGQAAGTTQHTLFVRADEGITRKTLYASFSPKNADHNATYDFQIEIEGREVVVNWDTFIGIYPCIYYGTSMYQIVFQSEVGSETTVSEVDAAAAFAAVVASTSTVTTEDAQAEAELAEIEAAVVATPAAASPAPVVSAAPAAQVQVQVKPQ